MAGPLVLQRVIPYVQRFVAITAVMDGALCYKHLLHAQWLYTQPLLKGKKEKELESLRAGNEEAYETLILLSCVTLVVYGG